MRIKICFELSMPNRGSWNGRWTGEGNLYAVIRDFKPSNAEKILTQGPYYYGWNDGWGASISARKVEGNESRSIRRRSKGFCGYDWMIDSIVLYGQIYANHERPVVNSQTQNA